MTLGVAYQEVNHVPHTPSFYRILENDTPVYFVMKKIRAAYQGYPGAYSDEACRQIFSGDSVIPTGFRTFEEVFTSVRAGTCDVAVLPFENSLGMFMSLELLTFKAGAFTQIMTSF